VEKYKHFSSISCFTQADCHPKQQVIRIRQAVQLR
jgi:hypothetical protein